MLSTSGSTGNKKWVKLSEDNLKSNILAVSSYFKIDEKNVTITNLPPEYTYGLSIINTHIYSGAKIILNNFSVMQKEFWQIINKYNVESFGGVPFTYSLLKKIKFQNLIKNTKLKYLTQAGGKLSEDMHRYLVKILLKNKIKFYVMYGAAEATARMSILSSNTIGSVGKPLKGYNMSLINKNKIINKPNNLGEIVFSGKNIFVGYSTNYKDLSKCVIREKLFTGDIGKFDRKGNFYIVGRIKRFIKLAGVSFNLDEIEMKLKEKYKKDFKATGKDDKLKIFSLKSIKTILNLKLKISKILKINPSFIELIYITKFPLTFSGKINYKNLLNLNEKK